MATGKQTRRPKKQWKHRRAVSISRIMAFAFLGIILVGTLLLNLPAASRSGRSAGIMTSLFTATSATCVTGLVLRDTWTQWSLFGQLVILLMMGLCGTLSGAVLKFKPITVSSVVATALSALFLMVMPDGSPVRILTFAILGAFALIVPGVILQKQVK